MNLRVRTRNARLLRELLKWSARGALVCGLGLMLWPVAVTVESAYAQWDGERKLAQSINERSTIPAGPKTAPETIVEISAAARDSIKSPPGTVLGRFEVPRLSLSYVLLEGTDNNTLDKSIGHVEGTGLVGEAGNIAIAGHRNTHFRKLEWIRRDDELVLTSPSGEVLRYLVEWTRIVKPTETQVLDARHGPAVTLITCFPFEYVGSAPMRMVVRALPDPATRRILAARNPGSDSAAVLR